MPASRAPWPFESSFLRRWIPHGSCRDLVIRALGRPFIRAPAHALGPVAEAIACHMVEPDLDHQFRLQGLPLPASFGAPAALAAGRLAIETRRLPERLKRFRQIRALIVGNRRGEADVIELAV